MTTYGAYDAGLPCKNPSCKSHGSPHPNCRCYGGGFADGGMVGNFCDQNRPHDKGCQFYAEGGQVMQPAPLNDGSQDDPQATVGHAAITHGLLGILNGAIGHAKLTNPEKNAKVIDDAKSQYKHRSNGPSPDGMEEIGPKKSVGTRLADHIFEGKHEDSADLMQSHPLVGNVGKANLEPMMGRLAKPMLDQTTDPEAMRGAVDYLHSSVKGANELKSHVKDLFEAHKVSTAAELKVRKETREQLKKKLEDVQDNPSQLLDVAGNLGHYMPLHASQVGATTATAINYLKGLKPKSFQANPLDQPTEANPLQEDAYNRQLDIAQDPMRIVHHTKAGTINPSDIKTMQTIYPGLHKSMVSQMGEELINAKAEGKTISYRHRLGMSHILGQPLDGSMTQPNIAAIISSAQPPDSGSAGGKPSKSSAVSSATQKTISNTDKLYETPLESLAANRKD